MAYPEYFKKPSKNDWIGKANADLKGKVAAEDLHYHIEDEIQFSPFLIDANNDNSINSSKTKSGVFIEYASEQISNTRAKSMLLLGAQVLALEVTPETNWEVLLHDIYLDMITVYCFCDESEYITPQLDKYISSNYKNIRPDIIILDKNDILSLDYTDKFTSRIKLFKDYIHSQKKSTIYVSVDLKKDFLTQIGELRAMRKTVEKEKTGSTLTILCFINPMSYMDNEKHPLIITNYLLMSAYLGLGDVAFGIPYGPDSELARLSLHVQNIFKEESSLQYVNDPTAGAYIIEKITQELSDYSP